MAEGTMEMKKSMMEKDLKELMARSSDGFGMAGLEEKK
jgi:hypothetical protein